MHIHFQAQFESSIDQVAAALADPHLWPQLIPCAEQLAEHWRYAGELYRARFITQHNTYKWAVESISGDPCLEITVTLHDQQISTLAHAKVIASSPGLLARLFGGAQLRQQIAEIARYAIWQLQTALQPAARSQQHASLAEQYPLTVAAFTSMGALEHIERISALDRAWDALRAGHTQPQQADIYAQAALSAQPSQLDFDLIYAGGGLGLIHAAVMARYGYRIMLFDRGEAGCAHREWNISRAELSALVELGFCTWGELQPIIMAEYRTGVVRFHMPNPADIAELWLPDVLNIALDAGALLQLARRKLIAAGGRVLDQRAFRRVISSPAGPLAVAVELARADGTLEQHTARLLLDGMGSASPLALRRFGGQPFAGVCPTVGTVAAGFVQGEAANQHNPQIGDILVSVADAQRGQQYMWEGFPGRGDDLTVYLFYYDTLVDERRKSKDESRTARLDLPSSSVLHPSSPSLMQLFEDYFALLPGYKRPDLDFRHIKPVYGYIPARHSLRRQEAELLRGVLPIGDSAAQQSPLTFCGFGSHVRNLHRTTTLLHYALRHSLLEPGQLASVSAFQVNVSLNWVFSRFMQPWQAPADVNRLQNIFLGVLNELGQDLAQRFFRDQMRWGDYHRMVLGMFRRHPQIVLIALRVLGAAGARQWAADYLIYCRAALLATIGRQLGFRTCSRLASSLGHLAPALGLRLHARIAEWRAMGWI